MDESVKLLLIALSSQIKSQSVAYLTLIICSSLVIFIGVFSIYQAYKFFVRSAFQDDFRPTYGRIPGIKNSIYMDGFEKLNGRKRRYDEFFWEKDPEENRVFAKVGMYKNPDNGQWFNIKDTRI